MAAPQMPYTQRSPQRGGVIFVLGVIAVAALAFYGQGQIALALLAAMGAAFAILLAAGQLTFDTRERSGEKKAKRVFGALPVPLAATTKKGKVIWASEAFSSAIENAGCDQDLSMLGENNSDTAAAMYRLFAAARQGKAHAETITLLGWKGGEKACLKVVPIVNAAEAAPALIWQIEEFDGRVSKPSCEAGLLLTGIDSIPSPALLVSKDLTIEGANKSFLKLFGYPVDKKLEGPVAGLLRGHRGAPVSKARLRGLLTKSDGPVPIQVASADKSFWPAMLYVRPGPGKAGAENGPYLWVVAPAPIADGGVEDLFESLLAQSPVAMALITSKGVLRTANKAFQNLFAGQKEGAPNQPQALIGKPLTALVSPNTSLAVRDRLAAISENALSASYPAELTASLRPPSNKLVRFIFSPAADGVHTVVIALEPAAAAANEEQFTQSQKLAAVGELAGGIAHDFNNLLTAIIGFSDLLLRRFRASDPAFKDLMNIKNNATRAAELVKQILAYSRRQTLRPAVLKLTDVIEEFQATMGRTIGEKVKAKIQHGRDLWYVKADEGQLFQVIMNLAVNARDAMPEGGELTIRTANVTERESLSLKDRGLERGEYVMCEVRDTGTGIKPEHLEKIFDPFFSTKEVGKGTGLGLSTVYGIVKQTGGTILVDSEIGAGATFRIYLPRYVETEEDIKVRQNRNNSNHDMADLTGSGKVLLVEDEEAVRSFASRALSTRGYTVLEAATGVEALEVMDREHGEIDLVVSDVVMPEMDGPTLLRHLRQRNPDVKIVFMSGYAEEAFRKNLGEDENFIFLPKPFTLKKLAETVKAAAA